MEPVSLRAQNRKDGGRAFAGVPQDILVALGDGYLHSVAESRVIALILLAQYQFENNDGKERPIRIESFVDRSKARPSTDGRAVESTRPRPTGGSSATSARSS